MQLESLAIQLASAEQDFSFILNDNITILDSSDTGAIPVTILSDTQPELRENFTVELTGVEVLGDEDILESDLPKFDDSPSIISIIENDDPYGRFVLHSGQLQEVSVQESDTGEDIPVMLIVEREGGTAGSVSVTWSATGVSASTNDFTGKGQWTIDHDVHVLIIVIYNN